MAACLVCPSPARYTVEQAYLHGSSTAPFDRRTVEAHFAHLADGDALRAVENMASAAAVSARLRTLEHASMAVLERALASDDPKVALLAIREARNTVAEMARIAGHLAARHEAAEARPDLDAAIARALGVEYQGQTDVRSGQAALPSPARDQG